MPNYLAARPFDSRSDTPVDLGLGGPSTEYLMTEMAPNGGFWNIPQIWYVGGKPVLVEPWQAQAFAREYETNTGKRFPRFDNAGVGAFSAMNRSALGGATNNALAR